MLNLGVYYMQEVFFQNFVNQSLGCMISMTMYYSQINTALIFLIFQELFQAVEL